MGQACSTGAPGCSLTDRAVDESPVGIATSAVYIFLYLILAALCAYAMRRAWLAAVRRSQPLRSLAGSRPPAAVASWVHNNNNAQILTLLSVAAVTRGVTLIPMCCIVEESLRALKDCAFFGAFAVMLVYWMELQGAVTRVSTVDRLRPWLYGLMLAHTAFRSAQAALDLLDVSTAYAVINAFTLLMYLGLGAAGTAAGCRLRGKMGSVRSGGASVRRKARRLTRFLVGEVAVLAVFLASVAARRFAFGWAQEQDPMLWFWLKSWEKALELASMALILATVGALPCRRPAKPSVPEEGGTEAAGDGVQLVDAKQSAGQGGSSARGLVATKNPMAAPTS